MSGSSSPFLASSVLWSRCVTHRTSGYTWSPPTFVNSKVLGLDELPGEACVLQACLVPCTTEEVWPKHTSVDVTNVLLDERHTTRDLKSLYFVEDYTYDVVKPQVITRDWANVVRCSTENDTFA